ncbi:MAG TPA: LD-carboxypeptidase [Polyangiaceae bacterium]|nr:LD-carboxypeptidase [Polyangiaceae bacterium]
MIVPPPLARGDRVVVVAPSGPFDRALVLRGVAWLRERYEVDFGEALFEQRGYLAGTDERRREELNRAIADERARAVVATRGGYGLTRIAHALDLSPLRTRPKWLVGFSDVTALHAEASRFGVASIHGHNVAGLGRGDDRARERWEAVLRAPTARRRFDSLTVVRGGRATGPVVGGNLTVLFSSAAAGRLVLPEGAVLLLEDVGEAPYRVDRMLTALLVAGALDRVAGVLLGSFTDSAPGRYGVPVEEVLAERLGELGVPVLAGFPAGHGPENESVVLGVPATLDGATASAELGMD